MTLQPNAVLLDAKASADAGPVWNQIACVGQWSGHPAGPFQLGVKEFGEMVANFKATTNRRIPVDFEHVSEMDPRAGTVPSQGAPAQGWMIDLDNRGAAGLWALISWLEPARTLIREGKYRYFSPTIRFNPADPKTGQRNGARLSSGALTNSPFLDAMQPLAASLAASSNLSNESETIMSVSISNEAVSSYAERLMSDGHAPEKARALAIASVARAVAASVNATAAPAETVALCARINGGELTIVQLADKIQADEKCDRDTAFDRAGTMLRASR